MLFSNSNRFAAPVHVVVGVVFFFFLRARACYDGWLFYCFHVFLRAKVIQGFAYEGAAADVWSLGVTLYAMLAGYLPYEAESLPAVFDKAQVKKNNKVEICAA